MAIFITGDTHGDFSRLQPAAFHEQRDLTKEDYLIICGDFGSLGERKRAIFCVIPVNDVSVGSSRPRFVGSNEPLFVGKPEANR